MYKDRFEAALRPDFHTEAGPLLFYVSFQRDILNRGIVSVIM